MLKTAINKLLMVIYFCCGALVLESVTFNFLGLGTMPEYFSYNFAIIFFIAMVIFIIPNFTAQYVVATLILGLQTVLIYVNYSLNTIYADLFSFDMFGLVKEATTAVTSDFVYISVILQLVALFCVIALLGALGLKYCRKYKIKIKQHFSVVSIIIILSMQTFAITSYFRYRDYIKSLASESSSEYVLTDSFALNTSFLKKKSYAKFGSYGYISNMIINYFSDNVWNTAKIQETITYFNNGKMYDGSWVDNDGVEHAGAVNGVDQGNNVIVIMMESMEWLCFGDGNYDSTYHNLSNELTPNIYNLVYGDTASLDDDGLISTSFFSKSKTNISEGYGILGCYPVGQSLSAYTSKEGVDTTTFGYSMPNVLKNNGYITSYVHSSVLSIYDRQSTHKSLGFDNVIGKENIKKDGENYYSGDDLIWDNWAREEDIVNNAMDYIVPSATEPFYTFYLNVSSHGSYLPEDNTKDEDVLCYMNYVKYDSADLYIDANGNYQVKTDLMREPNKTQWYTNILANYSYDEDLVSELLYYQCGAVGLDRAIGAIVQKLKTTYDGNGTSLFDKTTILLYSDHYSYYNQLSNRFKGFDEDDVSSIELNTIPMIISSPGLKALNATLPDDEKYLENTRFCSAYDIIPTLFDLLGIPFNENFYIGNSLFRPADVVDADAEEDIVVYYSNTGGLFSKGIYTYDLDTFIVDDKSINATARKDLFIKEASTVLIKINYMYFLNKFELYNQITTK